YIPDNSSYGVSVPIDFSGQSDLRVEHVEVTVNISHSFGGDLEAFLVSPSGAVSVLATPAFSGYENYQNWTFSSVRHWGEKSSGTWTFIVADRDALVSGTLNTVTVRIHGVPIEAPTLTTEPVNQFLVEGSSSSLVAEATGIRDIEYLWRRGTTQVKRSTSNEYAMAPVKLTHAGVYSVTALNMGGSDRSENFSVGVVRVQNVPVVVNVGRDLILDAIASAGVPLTYQWYKDGAPLVDDLRVKGSQTKRLIVRATVPDDSAVYHCIVSDGSASLSAGDRTVSIREKPIMDPAVLDGTIVAGNPYHLFTAVNEVTSFVATGVPSGMTFNRRTGELAGKPRVPGSYTIKVYAVNPAGRSEVAVYTLEVAALPQEIQGVFQGLIEREDGLTKSHGGRIQLTVSRTGSYSGFVYLGAERRSIRGYLDATPDGSPPTLDFRIYRGRTLPPYFVHLSFDASMEKATGEVNDGDTLTAAIEATRYAWHSRLNPATSLAGKYTAQASLPLASIGDAGVPQGVTALTLTASTAGTVRYSGRMGDLTAVSGSCYLDKNGKFSPFNRLYGNRGSVLGWLQIVADPGSEFADNSVSGSLDWNRLLQPATSRQYPLGFVPQILTASGSKFVPPPTGQIVLNLPDPATVPDGKNAGITFFGGNVESASLAGDLMDVPFSVALTHRTTFGVDNRIGNPALIRLTISRTTGALTGTFTLVDPNPLYPTKTIKRVVTYRGLLVGDQGVGAFGLLQLPDPGAVPAQRWPYTPLLHGGFLMQALNSGE
ncbi:MAG: proprotein convertase P-domain-containing protein, partial [Verrucomicrobiales bacterium]|nr:proprotein convertase P-domain-containing protein [Verrucomicrobiales bacterium]